MNESNIPFWKSITGGFIKVPKVLFRDTRFKDLSPLAKLLYALLLDRVSLSASNGDRWRNRKGEYYVIFTINEIAERLNCGRDKASRLLQELVDIGLIGRTRDKRSRAYQIVVFSAIIAENDAKEASKTIPANAAEIDFNNTDSNNLEYLDTHTNTSLQQLRYKIEVQELVGYGALLDQIPQKYLDCIVDVIVQILCTRKNEISIGRQMWPVELVQQRMKQLNEMDIQYVYDRLLHEKSEIHYLNGYILARLMEQGALKEIYYDRWVLRDTQQT